MEFHNYINGKWVKGQNTFQTINPANEEVLAQLLTRDMGKVIAEARGDVQEAIDMAYYMGGEGRRLLGYTAPVEMPNKFGMAVRDPAGVVGLITPWNFPIAVPSWKIFPALIAGNTIIWKPSPETPAISAAFVKVFEEAGLPAGVFNLLLAPGVDVAKALVNHPGVRVLSFTGSTTTGRAIAESAAKLNKKLSLEMGGKNAIIVMDDANVELVTDATLWAAFGTSGQRCTAASRLIVQRGIASKVKESLVERTKTLKLGNGLDEAVEIGPVINKAAIERIDKYVQIGQKEGARILVGGFIASTSSDIIRLSDSKSAAGFFYSPTLFDG